jgi:hypothetical protein
MGVDRIISHSKFVLDIALPLGWKPGARYTNLRDVKHLTEVFFVDIDWKNYDFDKHLWAVTKLKPSLTVARDLTDAHDLDVIVKEAEQLNRHARTVILVPKDPTLSDEPRLGVPIMFRLGYSVPTRYGGTLIDVENFTGEVHLLGGRPDVQRRLADKMDVRSIDGNRLTLDARFGDYFDGRTFKPHPTGGYHNCIKDSLTHVNEIWSRT